MTTHRIGHYWAGRGTPHRQDPWNDYTEANDPDGEPASPDSRNEYILEGSDVPVGRAGADGLAAITAMPHSTDDRGDMLSQLNRAMEQHNPTIMSLMSELIQNAMDQHADDISINYDKERKVLRLAHNGKESHDGIEPFNHKQLRGLFTNSARTKTNSIASEGRFGIGFKYWITLFERLTVLAKYSNNEVIRLDIDKNYSPSSIGLVINDTDSTALFTGGQSTIFEFYNPREICEEDCNHLTEKLDNRIKASLPMMAARKGGNVSIHLDGDEISATLEHVGSSLLGRLARYTATSGEGWMAAFTIDELMDCWENMTTCLSPGDFTKEIMFERLENFISDSIPPYLTWDEEQRQNLRREFRDAQIGLFFPHTLNTHGMAGSLFVAPNTVLNLPCHVQAPWMLRADRKSVEFVGPEPAKGDWNNMLSKLVHIAYLESVNLLRNHLSEGVELSFLKQILRRPALLARQEPEAEQHRMPQVMSLKELLSINSDWARQHLTLNNHQNFGHPGLANLLEHLDCMQQTTSTAWVESSCPETVGLQSEGNDYLPLFDWTNSPDAKPSITKMTGGKLDDDLVELIQNTINPPDDDDLVDDLVEDEPPEEPVVFPLESDFVDCFGTILVSGDWHTEAIFNEELVGYEKVADEFPNSEHGLLTLRCYEESFETSIYRLPTETENLGRRIQDDVKTSAIPLDRLLCGMITHLHRASTGPTDTELEHTMPAMVAAIGAWAESEGGLIQDFILVTRCEGDELDVVMVPKSAQKWLHIRGEPVAYGAEVRPNARRNSDHPRRLEIDRTTHLGQFVWGQAFSNSVPIPNTLLTADSIWAAEQGDEPPAGVHQWFAWPVWSEHSLSWSDVGQQLALQTDQDLNNRTVSWPSGFNVDEVIDAVENLELKTDLGNRLNVVFVDAIPIMYQNSAVSRRRAQTLLRKVQTNPLRRVGSYHHTRRLEVQTGTHVFSPPRGEYGLDLIPAYLRRHHSEVKPLSISNDYSQRIYKVNWKRTLENYPALIEPFVDQSGNHATPVYRVASGLILRVYGVVAATEDRLMRLNPSTPPEVERHILQVAKVHNAFEETAALWHLNEVFSVVYGLGSDDSYANLRINTIQLTNNDPPQNLLDNPYSQISDVFSEFREAKISSFQPLPLRRKGNNLGWHESRSSAHAFIDQPWLPVMVSDEMDWTFVNEVLGMREEGSQLPFPHPVTKPSFFSLNQIPADDAYRVGMELLIEALVESETRTLALKWLERMFEKGLGTGSIRTRLNAGLQAAEEAGASLDDYPSIQNTMSGRSYGGKDTYIDMLRRIRAGQFNEALRREFSVPVLAQQEDEWYVDFDGGIPFDQLDLTKHIIIDIDLSPDDRLPRGVIEVDDEYQLCVLPCPPTLEESVIKVKEQIPETIQTASLASLSEDAIDSNSADEGDAAPAYMNDLRARLEGRTPPVVFEVVQRREPEQPVRFGPMMPAMVLDGAPGEPRIQWANAAEVIPQDMRYHELIGQLIRSNLPDELPDELMAEFESTAYILVGRSDIEQRMRFKSLYLPSTMSGGQLESLLNSITAENFDEKLTELTIWYNNPNPLALRTCETELKRWYQEIPGLQVYDFQQGAKMTDLVPIMFGRRSSTGGPQPRYWMNLEVDWDDAPASASVLMKGHPCNLFLCTPNEAKCLSRYLPDDDVEAWNFFSRQPGDVAEKMAEGLRAVYASPPADIFVIFDSLIVDTNDSEIPIQMHCWHALLMCAWLRAWVG